MKYSALLLLFFLSIGVCGQAIKLEGQVLTAQGQKALPYVNIGIRGKNVGTTTNAQGRFILVVPPENALDTLSFSAIGYQAHHMAIKQISPAKPMQVKLQEKAVSLKEVLVRSHKLKRKKLGVTGRLPLVWGSPENIENRDIYEFANLIRVKAKPSELVSAHFYLASTKLDSALFRINLYRVSDGLPGERLVEKSIVDRLSAKAGWVSIDLQPYALMLDEDFFLGIEYLPAEGADRLAVSLGAKLGGKAYSRKSSLGTWDTFNGASLSGYVEVWQ
ncbi:carboxypeptidase-like regulatory domain-containing protein [Pontibacter oryzae]|uniref:Carboxypeptidase-like regulatory domain-containing protein n=1 Tax=Pontibacter oryzae TaxID=2304593 RepID=A0A399RTU5_9BACT|nr:carboxypeptidase-like regulatory domain-containing protein [Pontibacter oryzae]RIJ33469.1 carboxypeptidase-like regulatory domain-containing protein [Pontibacter oryzae]